MSRLTGLIALITSCLWMSNAMAQAEQTTASVQVPAAAPALVFSTYLGGSGRAMTFPLAVAVDRSGYIYVTGRTEADDFPSVNAAQRKRGGGGNDAFVIKLTPDGQQIVYSTLLGGRDREWGESISVDATGHAYVAGTTYSPNFPTTAAAAQRRFGGGDRDAFVAKFGPEGQLIYSTLLGGTGTDRATALAIDAEGAAYIAGSTNSAQLAMPVPIAISGAAADLAPSGRGGGWDVLVAKLDTRGSSILYARRFGGSGDSAPSSGGMGGEGASGMALDSRGRLWVSGYTDRRDFPVRGGSSSSAGDGTDGFVARLDAQTGALEATTFPGNSRLGIAAVATDHVDNIYVAGTTDGDIVAMKLSADLKTVGYRVRIRARGRDQARAIAVDERGRAHVAGTTNSPDLPVVAPLQPHGGSGDVCVVTLAPDGKALVFSTPLGGRLTDEATGIAVDPSGALVVVGDTSYGDFAGFPVVRALQQERRNTTSQGFVSKIAAPGSR